MSNYAHPDVLVETEWVAEHLRDPKVRLVEVDVDTSAYDSGHIPGAVGWNWKRDTQQTVRRDVPEQSTWEALLSRSGIGNDTTIVFYGDYNNLFDTFAFRLEQVYGHADELTMH